jgi:hypothetical protein
MPLTYISSLPNGGILSNFITTPYGSVFQIQGGTKHLILDYKSYITANPSDKVSFFSYFGANTIPSGTPVSSQPFLVKFSSSSMVYLFNNGSYYAIPSFDAYVCWGFNNGQKSPLPSYTLPEDSYVADISSTASLGCIIAKDGSSTYVVSNGLKYSIPSSYNITPSISGNADINQVLDLIPAVSTPLSPFVKGNTGAAVWFIDNGKLRVVPTYQDYVNLHVTGSNLTTLDSSALSSFRYAGIKLAPGSLVKSSSDSAVYAISGDGRIPYTTSTAFLAHGNSWGQISTYSQSDLDTNYPAIANASMGAYLYDSGTGVAYLADSTGCFSIQPGMLSAYSLDQGTLSSNPATSLTSSSNFHPGQCAAASVYVKQTGQSLVYKLVNGTRQPVNTFAKLQSDSGQSNPYVIALSSDVVNSFSIGSPL